MQKRKLIITLSLLLICIVLLTTAAYAWLVISQMPEVSGISTRVGANGSLEVALLTDETYLDPTLIKTKVGSSAEILDLVESNVFWGSLVDLSSDVYGLNAISVLPSRLNVRPSGDREYTVSTNMLAFPEYSADGRFTKMHAESVTALYKKSEFVYSTEAQNYGVRGIGTVSSLSPQQAALVNARSAVSSYMSASVSATKSAWQSNGSGILSIYFAHYIEGKNTYSNADVAIIRDTATRALTAISYVDLALRQSLIGYASSFVDDRETFTTIRDTVENTSYPLSVILSAVSVNIPTNFSKLVETVENDKLTLQYIIVACDKLRGNNYGWEVIYPILNELIDANAVYLDEIKLSSLNSSVELKSFHELVVAPGAGVMADIADYSGNYSAFVPYANGIDISVESASAVKSAHLEVMLNELASLEAAAGDETAVDVPLNQVYGYAVDMAFRCNAESDLLLQTAPIDRVDKNASDGSTIGGGSYMQFTSEQLDEKGIVTDFKRVVSDLMILKLDSKAVKANIAQIVVDDYIDFEFHQIITPYVEILTNVYPELKKEDILAINWAANNWFGSDDEVIIRAITPTQITYLEKLVVRAKAVNIVAEELDNAQNILNNAYSDEYDERLNATEDSANAVISALEHMVRAAEEEQTRIENEQHDPATSPMSSDQRYVLTAAVSSAKSLPGFDDVEKTELDSIRTEVVAVETLLAQETGITEQKAEEALAALNALIVEAGGKEVTAYNTILHTVPTGSEIKTVVNTVDATNANLYIGGVVGQTQFSAVVLTRNGIVIELSKSVTFYVHAEAPAQIHNSEDENISGTSVPQILVSGSALNAFLAQQTERAYITIDGKEYFYGEEIKECKWASSDSRVIIDKTDIDSCVITAEEEITAVITLVVETVQGNKYSAEVTVTVQP